MIKHLIFFIAILLFSGAAFADGLWDDEPATSLWDDDGKSEAQQPAAPQPTVQQPAIVRLQTTQQPDAQPIVQQPVVQETTTPQPIAQPQSIEQPAEIQSPEPQQNDGFNEWGQNDQITFVPMEDNMVDQTATTQEEAAAQAALAPAKAESKSSIKIHWIPLSICAGITIVGGILAYVFDNKAKTATEGIPVNHGSYQQAYEDAGKFQNQRNIAIGIAAAGLVGMGITFLF